MDANAGLVSASPILNFANRDVGMMPAILVDLDGDGLEARRMKKTAAAFDMDGDGIADNTGWVSGGDGMLVIDRNGDGQITGAAELSFLSEGEDLASAWAGLAKLDSDGDRKISAADTRFGELKVWTDGNANGITDEGELKSLADLGITEIALTANEAGAEAKLGRNVPLTTSTFTWESGVTGTIGNVALAYEPSSTKPATDDASAANTRAAALLSQAMSSFGTESSDDLSRSLTQYSQDRLDLLTAHAA